MRKSLLSVVGLLVGLALLGFDARWVSGELGFTDPARALVGRWFGAELFALDVEGARAAVATLTPPAPLGLAWAVLAFGLGALGLARVQAALAPERPVGAGARVLLGCASLFALSPWLFEFVVQRTASSADLYLDLGDVVRALGLGLVFASLVLPRAVQADPGERAPRRASALAAAALSVLLPLATSHAFLDGEPLTNDGVSYRFQAEVFAQGELARPTGTLGDFFPARQVLPGARATSKYPPGHALLLAPGTALGFPRLVPFLLLGLATYLVFGIARMLGARAPDLAAWVFALSPMVIGIESTWLSHGTSLPCCVLFLYAWLRACGGEGAAAPSPERGADAHDASRNGHAAPGASVGSSAASIPSAQAAAFWPLLAGLAIGLAFNARPLTAVALAVPTALVTLRAWRVRNVALALLGFAPALAFFLAVNHAITGSALRTVYGLYAAEVSANDQYGFMNLATAGPYSAYNLARLSAWGVGFGMLGMPLVLAWRVARPRRFAALLWAAPLSFLLLYSLHRFQGIPWFGPLYFVEVWPLLAILVAGALAYVAARYAIPRTAVVLALAVGAANLALPHFVVARDLVQTRTAPARLAAEWSMEQQSASQLVVFVPQNTPDEVKLFPLPIPDLTHITWPVFARDLGDDANRALANALGATAALRYDRARGALVEMGGRE